MSIPQDRPLGMNLPENDVEASDLRPSSDDNVGAESPPRSERAMLDGNNREDNQTTSNLDPKKLKAAVALALGETETKAAQIVGVNRTTIYRWQQDPEFVAELNRLKREYVSEQRARLRGLVDRAITTLETCLQPQDPAGVNVKVAMFVLSQFAPRAHVPIGPTTESGVNRVFKDNAIRPSTSDEVRLARVTEP